jgi:hypothetical protein
VDASVQVEKLNVEGFIVDGGIEMNVYSDGMHVEFMP